MLIAGWRWVGLAALATAGIVPLRLIGVGDLELAVILACLVAAWQTWMVKR